jgi:hypothetical protein
MYIFMNKNILHNRTNKVLLAIHVDIMFDHLRRVTLQFIL